MKWKRKIAEYEADLYKHPPARFFRVPRGETEFKEFEDGERQFEFVFHGLKINDNAHATILVNGQRVLDVMIRSGRAHLNLSTERGDTVPKISDGDIIELSYGERIFVKGVFKPDK